MQFDPILYHERQIFCNTCFMFLNLIFEEMFLKVIKIVLCYEGLVLKYTVHIFVSSFPKFVILNLLKTNIFYSSIHPMNSPIKI